VLKKDWKPWKMEGEARVPQAWLNLAWLFRSDFHECMPSRARHALKGCATAEEYCSSRVVPDAFRVSCRFRSHCSYRIGSDAPLYNRSRYSYERVCQALLYSSLLAPYCGCPCLNHFRPHFQIFSATLRTMLELARWINTPRAIATWWVEKRTQPSRVGHLCCRLIIS